jgi:hypothetical protein
MDFAPQDRIRLGDIDGDGRIDVCAIIADGDLCMSPLSVYIYGSIMLMTDRLLA